MSFAAPFFLWALPLAAAPILFHLLSRRRAARVSFSDLTLLKRVHARVLPRTRLRQWLLIAARCLVVLGLVLAYARPVLRASAAEDAAKAAAGEGLDLVLLLDTSYSMGLRERGKTRFELARQEAVDLLRGLAPADRVAVGLFSDSVESGPLKWLGAREAAAALERAKVGYRTTDYAPALRTAAEFLASGAGRRRRVCLVLSDAARHGFHGPVPPLEPGIAWLGLRWPAPAKNAAVLSAAPASDSSALKPRLLARVSGAAEGGLELFIEGRRAQGAALGPGRKEQTASLSLPAPRDPERPAWSGWTALRPDALPSDDVFYFSMMHPARPRILCLYGNPAFFRAPNAGFFLRELFGGARESLLDYQAEFLELGRMGDARLSDYRAVVLADFKEIPPAASSELERYVRGGGGLWILPGARTSPSGFDALNAWLPAQYGSLVYGEGPGLRPAPGRRGPWREFDLSKVAVARYYLLTLRAGAAALFKSSSGYPLLAAGPHGRGRAALWASALDSDWSNLAVKPAFAAWVQAVLEELTGASSRPSEDLQAVVGQPLTRVWAPDEAAPASVRLRAPDGRATTLWLKDRSMSYLETTSPGLYTAVEEGSGRRWVYAVNLDRRTGESDPSPLEAPPWKPVDSGSLLSDFRLEVYGRDARSGVLAAAAAFVVLEMLLSLPAAAWPATMTATGTALLVVLLLILPTKSFGQQGDRFIWSQIKLGPEWDPYPGVSPDVLEFLSNLTSVLSAPERRVLSLDDPALYSSPLIVLAGRQAPPPLSAEQRRALRDYLLAGGTLWAEDVSGAAAGTFDRWLRQALPQVLPEAELAPLPADHVVYKTFFLLRGPAGRVMARDSLEGVVWAGRAAVIYSRNDILGAWAKDALGKPLFECTPGGEAQRIKAKRLALNIIMYALTGSYKADAVHQPYLLQKMRSGVP